MDKPSPDPIERITQIASELDGYVNEPDHAHDLTAEALRLIAEQLDALRNPQ